MLQESFHLYIPENIWQQVVRRKFQTIHVL